MKKVRVGVIGCGSVARRRHLLEYASNEQAEIVAVVDLVEERAQEMAELYQAKAFTDYKEALAECDLDAVSVCLPNHLHASVTIDALKAGLHVLCEKPMAISAEEAEAMISTAKEYDRKLMIGHNQRFVASHQQAKKLLDSGELGKVYSFKTTFGHPGPEGWSIDGRASWFFNTEEAFIGALGDLGVHKSDLIRYLLGDVAEVGAFVETSAKENTEIDDNAMCILKMKSGAIGSLAASWSYVSGGDNSTYIYTEKAVLKIEADPVYPLVVSYSNGDTVNYELAKIQSNEEGGQTKTYVVDRFIEAITQDKEPLITGEEGLKSLNVILAALESNRTKRFVNLDQ
ncbi:Gfo/Idh/MocA family protein [Jeotgalibacillus proteolyticus]|uniref:Gfo/Idh/MocA family oxidoreductase n=1 Tax=Jeotgalibacillus proteolyticus TaxID=2082395 RepID=A0A2S5GCT9_9BACL|nr:Gfo/Idh/MocA family oxidoreductase [Jeotgalibacillus proteolyticus]PPA70816.1 gfo/Idh/MocA family oxidoreductase [Jeotgalibacillus proteolyticus]